MKLCKKRGQGGMPLTECSRSLTSMQNLIKEAPMSVPSPRLMARPREVFRWISTGNGASRTKPKLLDLLLFSSPPPPPGNWSLWLECHRWKKCLCLLLIMIIILKVWNAHNDSKSLANYTTCNISSHSPSVFWEDLQ